MRKKTIEIKILKYLINFNYNLVSDMYSNKILNYLNQELCR